MQQIHFGMQIEKPSVFQIFVGKQETSLAAKPIANADRSHRDWDNKQKHVDFMQSSTYKPFLTGRHRAVFKQNGQVRTD